MRLIATAFALTLSSSVLANPLPQYVMSGGNQLPEIVSVPCSTAYDDGSFERGICYLHSWVTMGGETAVAFQRDFLDRIEVFSTAQGTYQILQDGEVLIETEVRVSFDECDPTIEDAWRLEIMEDSDHWGVFCLGSI
jgi:phenolic acid decarboxylase